MLSKALELGEHRGSKLAHRCISGKMSQSSKEEKGETSEKSAPVGFWNPALKETRKDVAKNWALTTFILCVFILSVLSMYWGAEFRVEDNLSSLVVWVVDFDGQEAPYDTSGVMPLVGPQIVRAAEALVAPTGSLGWGSLPPSHFHNNPLEVRQRIYDYKAWAAIIVNANATALLQEAIRIGNSSYDPMGAAQVIYVQARDEQTISNYIVPQLQAFQTQVTGSFGKMWAGMVLSEASTNNTILANIQSSPQAISPAIGFSTFNLRPFSPAVITPAVTVGLIYLIILAFFSFGFFMPLHVKFMSNGHRALKFYQFIIYRWCSTILAYFVISLAYSLVSLAFQIPFSKVAMSEIMVEQPTDAYHRGSFPVYWMVNFVGMMALGLASENMAMILGQPWVAFWLIFWVITNVTTSFYAITLEASFYDWGYAWPLHNVVEASRSILFNLHSEIGLNFGVLFAWAATNTAFFPFCCYFMRWKTQRAKNKGQ